MDTKEFDKLEVYVICHHEKARIHHNNLSLHELKVRTFTNRTTFHVNTKMAYIKTMQLQSKKYKKIAFSKKD